ncbi:hypothetical protein C5167_027710 [Papaver somniferum]|nr:hypothetical protein C5167_027710 [Papaver somniferum]
MLISVLQHPHPDPQPHPQPGAGGGHGLGGDGGDGGGGEGGDGDGGGEGGDGDGGEGGDGGGDGGLEQQHWHDTPVVLVVVQVAQSGALYTSTGAVSQAAEGGGGGGEGGGGGGENGVGEQQHLHVAYVAVPVLGVHCCVVYELPLAAHTLRHVFWQAVQSAALYTSCVSAFSQKASVDDISASIGPKGYKIR